MAYTMADMLIINGGGGKRMYDRYACFCTDHSIMRLVFMKTGSQCTYLKARSQ